MLIFRIFERISTVFHIFLYMMGIFYEGIGKVKFLAFSYLL